MASSGQSGLADRSGGPLSPEPIGQRQGASGQLAAAVTAGLPIRAPVTDGDIRRIRQTGGVTHPGGGQIIGGIGRGGAGARSAPEFGPRPAGVAAPVAESRMSASLGRGAADGVSGGRAGDLISPIGGARGQGGEDTERRRPSYLIELDDIFTDGRKVAPPVIGGDPPKSER